MATRRRITSRDNADFKALRALAEDPRETRRQGRTMADGIHLVGCLLDSAIPVQCLLVGEAALGAAEVAALLARGEGIPRIEFPDALFRAVSPVAAPAGIAAVFAPPADPTGSPTADSLLLDAVQDAGNVGTLLRTAAAAGIVDVVLGSGCAGAWTPRVLRAGQGAHFRLRIREQSDLASLLDASGMAAIATLPDAERTIYETDLRPPHWWLFGNEGSGLSSALVARAARRVSIPMAAGTESLNVAAAAAVCLFETVRQRRG